MVRTADAVSAPAPRPPRGSCVCCARPPGADRPEPSSDTSGPSDTAPPTAVTDPVDVVSATCAGGLDNVLLATCAVDLATPSAVSVTLESGDLAVRFTSEAVAAHHEIPVWGLRAEAEWAYIASAGGRTEQGTFTTGALPEAIAGVRAAVTGNAAGLAQVVLPAECERRAHLVALDARGDIRWYHYFAGATGERMSLKNFQWTSQQTVLGMSQLELAEFDLLGNEVWRLPEADLPMHHDVFRSGELRYVLQADTWVESDGVLYVEDLVTAYDATGTQVFRWLEHDHLDARGQSTVGSATWGDEFPGALDAWHTNALWVEPNGDFVLSLKQPNVLLRVTAADGELAWVIDGDGTGDAIPHTIDFVGGGDPGFDDQHNVQLHPDGTLALVDNGHVGDMRGLELTLDVAAGTVALQSEWPVPDLDCPTQSSLFPLPNGGRLLTCTEDHVVVELDSTGVEVWRATLTCPPEGELPPTVRGYPVDLWSMRVGDVVATGL